MSINRSNLLKPHRVVRIDRNHDSSSDIDDEEENQQKEKTSQLLLQKHQNQQSYSAVAKAHLKERPIYILETKRKFIKKHSISQCIQLSEESQESQSSEIRCVQTITTKDALRKKAKYGVSVPNKIKLQPDKRDENSQQCSICLSDLKGMSDKKIGMLPCKHVFCLKCIMESSKFSNRCPYCRANYNQIKCNNKNIEVPEARLNQEFDDPEDDPCYVCGRNDDFNRLLQCQFCEYAYCHTYCDSRLNSQNPPPGEWYCHSCEVIIENQDQNNMEIDVELQEEMD